ncbi:MAG: hypothetical protein KGL40_12560 [Rhodocyclaceae bacterium]|nr:hypothetical protein [Rhodocyclaceae bacterium]
MLFPTRQTSMLVALAISSILMPAAHAEGLTGQYLATGNVSTIGESLTSMNNRIGINYAPTSMPGNFDYRFESYTETSFHGAGDTQVNERKLENQLMYNYPLNEHVTATVGGLYHTNYTFQDTYYWAMGGVTLSGDIAPQTSASVTALVEKRNKGGRAFYDLSGNIEYKFHPLFGMFAAVHVYENLGELDIKPSKKREYEIGINHYISQRLYAGVSYFHHTQIGDPNDRFAMAKLKFGVNF